MRKWSMTSVSIRIVVGLAVLVGMAVLAFVFMAWWTERRVQSIIAAVRAAGDPASIGDLAPQPIPDGENAAVFLERLGPRLDAFSKEYARFSDSPVGKAYNERDPGDAATAEQIAAIRGILEKYREIPTWLAEAADEQYASTADFSLDHQKFLDQWLKNHAGRVRTAARFLNWRNEVLLSKGKHEEAARQSVELFRLARLYDAEPLVVNYLVGVAVRGIAANMLYDALAAGPVAPETYAAVEKELSLHDTPQRLLHALKTERAYGLNVVEDAGMVPGGGANRPFYLDLVAWPVKLQYLSAVKYWDVQIPLIQKTWPKPNTQVGKFGPEAKDLGTMAELMVPALQAAYDAESRIVAVIRAMRVFNALAEYRIANEKEASGLDELRLPPAATIDPYSGEPLRLKSTGDGWIVYSVMKNGVDDGGDFKEMKDFGVAPRKLRETE
jgi:hypothetical protein